MVEEGLFGEWIELAAKRVGFDLFVPLLGIAIDEPFAEGDEFLCGERGNLFFDLLEATHEKTLPEYTRG